jgi:hypothetical protein
MAFAKSSIILYNQAKGSRQVDQMCCIAIQKSFVPLAQREMWYKTFLGNDKEAKGPV